MGTTKTVETVAEHLLGQEANIATIARAIERDERTVYRALQALKKNDAYRVLRSGEHGDYVYRVERVEKAAS